MEENIKEDLQPQTADSVISAERTEKGQFKPGVSGNPGGRPRKKKLEDYYSDEEIEDLILRVKQDSMSKSDILKLVVEQIFGKAKQQLELSGDKENPVQVEVSEKIAGKRKLYDPEQLAK